MNAESAPKDLLTLSKNSQALLLSIEHLKNSDYTVEDITNFIKKSDYKNFKIYIDSITNAVNFSALKDVKFMVVAERKNAELIIDLDPFKMYVKAKLVSAFGGEAINSEKIYTRLKELKVTRGIITSAINLILKKSAQSAPGSTFTITIAKGQEAKDGYDTYCEPLVHSAKNKLIDALSASEEVIDIASLESTISVASGTKLMRIVPFQAGEEGFTVTGETIPCKKGTDIEVKLGSNTKFSDDDPNLILATTSGTPTVEGNEIGIEPVLFLESFDSNSKPLQHKGNLIIKGDITPGAEIVATGDITILGFIESSFVKCGGDLFVANGIIGEKIDENNSKITCIVKCGGSLYTNFIQYSTIYIGQDLNIKRQLLHSNISCGGYVTVQDHTEKRGAIFGGVLNAIKGVRTVNLGATSGVKTIVNLAGSYNRLIKYKDSLYVSLEKIKKALETSNSALKKLNNIQPTTDKNKLKEYKELSSRLHASIQGYEQKKMETTNNIQLTQDKIQIYMNETSLHVSNSIFNNVLIKIGCHMLNSKKQRLKSATIRVKSNKIIADKLENFERLEECAPAN